VGSGDGVVGNGSFIRMAVHRPMKRQQSMVLQAGARHRTGSKDKEETKCQMEAGEGWKRSGLEARGIGRVEGRRVDEVELKWSESGRCWVTSEEGEK
jgi:hypothetical protein